MVVNVVAVVILAILTLAGMIAVGSSRWTVRAGKAALPDSSIVRPALVHFMMSACHPGTAAYDATILDLAARGFIGARSDVNGIWLTYTEPGTATAGVRLAGYEQKVLDALHGRLKNTGGAPFPAVAHVARVDVAGAWKPFEDELRLAARSSGVCRRRLPLSFAPVLVAILTEVSAVVLAAVAPTLAHHHHSSVSVTWAAITAFVTPLILLGIGYQDRLTPIGAGLAARFKQERAKLAADPASWGMTPAGPVAWPEVSPNTLARRAFAVAGAIPGAGPDPVTPGQRLTGRVASKQPSEKQKPTEAWSSFNGNWRLVPIRKSTGPGMGAGVTPIPTIGGYGTLYRGENGNLSLIVATSGVANFGVKVGQRSGTPLPGIADGAWLVSEGKSVMMAVGEHVAKITISGKGVVGHPELMRSLAEKLAPRIVAQAARAKAEATGDPWTPAQPWTTPH